MALASYGDPGLYLAPLFDVVDTHVHGRLTRTHAPGIADLAKRTGFDFGPPGRHGEHELSANAAAYVQDQTERALYALAEQTIASTGLPNLCFAGGVALNCVAADKLRRLDTVTGYFAPPAASDRGQALGCALYAWHRHTGDLPRRPLTSDYFGRDYTDTEIEQALHRDPRSGLVERRRRPFTWRRENDIARTAAEMIADGKIVGWFQGGSELGPRALGARSILADPRTLDSADALNHRIKHREPFRPFAPAVLAEHASTEGDRGRARAGHRRGARLDRGRRRRHPAGRWRSPPHSSCARPGRRPLPPLRGPLRNAAAARSPPSVPAGAAPGWCVGRGAQ